MGRPSAVKPQGTLAAVLAVLLNGYVKGVSPQSCDTRPLVSRSLDCGQVMVRRLSRFAVHLAVGGATALALLLAVGVTGVLDGLFLYFPERELAATPSEAGLAYEDVSFTTEDGISLHGWFVPGRGDVTWLWFHGNAGNISNRLGNLELLHDRLGVNVFLFDYRGYGQSQGTPSEKGLYLDAEAALAYLNSRADVRSDRIVYFGRSLGGAVAVDLAGHQPAYGLILESPFPSVSFVARGAYPFLPAGFVRRILRARYDALSKIAGVTVPVLVLHGDKDDIVPLDGGRLLFEAAREPKQFHVIPGAGHNDTYIVGGEPYFALLASFLERLAR